MQVTLTKLVPIYLSSRQDTWFLRVCHVCLGKCLTITIFIFTDEKDDTWMVNTLQYWLFAASVANFSLSLSLTDRQTGRQTNWQTHWPLTPWWRSCTAGPAEWLWRHCPAGDRCSQYLSLSHRQTDRQTNRQTDKHTDKVTDTDPLPHGRDRIGLSQLNDNGPTAQLVTGVANISLSQTNRQIDKQTNWQTHRQSNRHTDPLPHGGDHIGLSQLNDNGTTAQLVTCVANISLSHRQTDRQTNRQTDKTHRQSNKHTDPLPHGGDHVGLSQLNDNGTTAQLVTGVANISLSHRQTDRQTNRQTDKHTDKVTDTQTPYLMVEII